MVSKEELEVMELLNKVSDKLSVIPNMLGAQVLVLQAMEEIAKKVIAGPLPVKKSAGNRND